jgi:hypothetical protein
MLCSPNVLNLSQEFDLVYLHHLSALRDWHCYRRYDAARVHFERAVTLARPTERPNLYSSFRCDHVTSQGDREWKRNVDRMFQSYRMFLGFQEARISMEKIGMITTVRVFFVWLVEIFLFLFSFCWSRKFQNLAFGFHLFFFFNSSTIFLLTASFS